MQAFKWLGTVASIFSAVMLVKYGFDVGSFVAPLQLALEWYEAFMRFLFGWAEPYLRVALVHLLGWTDWDPQLYPHWKHIFVLVGIYLLKSKTQHMTARGLEVRLVFHSVRGAFEVTKSVLRLMPCLFIALAASVCAGAVPLNEGGTVGNFVVAAVVIASVALNDFVYHFEVPLKGEMYLPLIGGRRPLVEGEWAGRIGKLTIRLLGQGIVGLAIIALALQVPWVQRLQSPAIAMLAFLVIARALYWFAEAHWFHRAEIKELKARGEHDLHHGNLFYSVFPPNIPGNLSFDTLSIFLGAGSFVAANAGLRLLGL